MYDQSNPIDEQQDAEPWTPPEVEPEHRYFETDDGVRIHYVEWPSARDAPTIVMVHGRRAHARWFDPVAMKLSPQYRCVSMDLRGHGESDGNEPATLQRYAADIAQLVERCGEGQVALMAHSMAGRLAILANQDYAMTPDLLIMADAPLYRSPPKNKREPRLRAQKFPSKELAISRFRLLPPGTSAHADLIRYIAEHAVRQDEDGTWSWKFSEEGTSRPFGANFPSAEELDLEKLACPALVIYGEHSMLFDAEEAQMLASRFARAEVAEIAEAYHHIMLDRPQGFTDAVLGFFRSHGFE